MFSVKRFLHWHRKRINLWLDDGGFWFLVFDGRILYTAKLVE
jgi:hypothetical protein